MNPYENNAFFENKSVEERLKWVWEKYDSKLCMTSSFQTQSVPLLYLISKSIPEIPILFLDTGFHFPETLAFRDELIEKYNLNVVIIKTGMGHDNFKFKYGNLYQMDPDLCCHINKTLPLQEELDKYDGWITGVRGDQTKDRGELSIFNTMPDGKVKFCPIVDWDKRNLWKYHSTFDLPSHPLFSQGYMSIGCAPCTRPMTDANDERSGRWNGDCKTECGIHTSIGLKKENE